MRGEGGGPFPFDGVDQGDQSWGGRERFDERLVIKDLVPDLREGLGREVQEGAPIEALGTHAVDKPGETGGPGVKRGHESSRECLRLVGGLATDGDDDFVELSELLRVLSIARDVGLSRRQEMQVRRLERELHQGDGDGEHGENNRDEHRALRIPATAPDGGAERLPRSQHGDMRGVAARGRGRPARRAVTPQRLLLWFPLTLPSSPWPARSRVRLVDARTSLEEDPQSGRGIRVPWLRPFRKVRPRPELSCGGDEAP